MKFQLAIAASSICVVGALAATAMIRQGEKPNTKSADGKMLLPNGWSITPAGRPIPLSGDMPLKLAFTTDGKGLLVATGGWHNQAVSLIDLRTEKVASKLELARVWAGLAVDQDKVLVSGGSAKTHTLTVNGTELKREADLPMKTGWTSGIAAKNGVFWIADVNTGHIDRYEATESREATLTGRPYSVALSPDGKQLAVTLWAASKVAILDSATLQTLTTIEVGKTPNEMVWSPDGRLFVACSGSNTVSVIAGNKVLENIKTSLTPKDPVGSTPIAVALTPDAKTLFVANADNNDVAVIDVSKRESRIKGFIPTGWYPSALAVSPDGKKLFVGTGKGLTFGPNGSVSSEGKPKMKYIASLLEGTLNVVDLPDEDQLEKYTAQVKSNFPQPTFATKSEQADGMAALKKIKHVLYIIRENRTYDQVFGDVPKGNGDKSLVMFGQKVTPNAHELINRFTLLDNTYCNGEVSEDGHQWCNGAYATEFVQKAWINSYSGKGEPEGDDELQESPAGYLWDQCRKKGIDYRSYGEFASFKSSPDTAPIFNGNKGLTGHASEKWSRGGRDWQKVDVFIEDLKAAESTGKWPGYMVMSLGEDHTSGLRAGAFTPQAAVASNDYGVGKLVDAISHSKFWKDTAIFIIEDDAQNGPDHVDAHRTVAMVVSPYVKKGYLDNTMYTTASMIRTMEIILGLPPMTQYDKSAQPMFGAFTRTADLTPYTVISPLIDIEAKNPTKGKLVEESNRLNWSKYDAADPDKLNEILWKALKPGTPVPAPTRSARLGR